MYDYLYVYTYTCMCETTYVVFKWKTFGQLHYENLLYTCY